jgi:maltooligosyltrehalose trehalohydrolase
MALAVRTGRQREFAAFGWNPADIPDPESVDTFYRSKLNWDEVHEGRHDEMLEWYRKLIRLRRDSPFLNDGRPGQTEVLFDEQQRWLMMMRGAVTVMCNLGEEAVALDHPKEFRFVLASRSNVVVVEERVVLPPDTLAVFSKE